LLDRQSLVDKTANVLQPLHLVAEMGVECMRKNKVSAVVGILECSEHACLTVTSSSHMQVVLHILATLLVLGQVFYLWLCLVCPDECWEIS